MLVSIDNRRLTPTEHRQWKAVKQTTGSGAAATAAVQKSRKRKTEGKK